MDDVEALTTIVGVLKQLDPETQLRVLQSVHRFLALEPLAHQSGSFSVGVGQAPEDSPIGEFSKDRSMSAKEFMRDKAPASDVERVACLAYFLSQYRSTPFFKTIDISALNVEAAQPKFSNASFAVDNATKRGYLVSANKGAKQISAAGEHYVSLLPDRTAAKDAMDKYRLRRKGKQKKA